MQKISSTATMRDIPTPSVDPRVTYLPPDPPPVVSYTITIKKPAK